MSNLTWGENPACLATYRILEADDLFDAFDEDGLPFADASESTIGELPIFFHTGSETELRAKTQAKAFLSAFRKRYLTDSKISKDDYWTCYNGLREAFANKDTSLLSIAEVLFATFYAEGDA